MLQITTLGGVVRYAPVAHTLRKCNVWIGLGYRNTRVITAQSRERRLRPFIKRTMNWIVSDPSLIVFNILFALLFTLDALYRRRSRT